MENIFKKILTDEVNNLEKLQKNKQKALKIVEDLKELLPLESIEKVGYNSIHIGKIGNPYSISKQSQISYSNNKISFNSTLLLHKGSILFDNIKYDDIISRYSKGTSLSPNQHHIEIDLESDMSFKSLYWLVKKEVLEIR